MAKIGLMATRDLTQRNMEHMLFRVTEILAQKHQVDLIGVHAASERIKNAFNIIPCQPKSTFSGPIISRVLEVRDYIKSENPDVVMAVSSVGVNGLSVAIAAKLSRKKSIVRLTSDVFEVYKTRKRLKSKLSLFVRNNVLGRVAMWLSDKVVLLHDAQLEGLLRSGYRRDRFYTVPQPVTFPECENIDNLRGECRGKLGVPDNAYIAATMFRLDANKKIDLLKDVISGTIQKDKNVFFVIIGTGDKRAWLIDHFRNDKRVIFIDQIQRDDLASYYSACDVVLHMSDSEGLSNVMIEALYFEKPVIATDSGCITRDIVSNIVVTSDDFRDLIVSRSAVIDQLPESLETQRNCKEWHNLITEVAR